MIASGLQLQVGTEFLDMPVEFEAQLNRFNPLFQTEGVIRDDYTLPIPLPHTDHNARVLGYPGIIENRSRFQVRNDAILYYNGMPQIRGQLRIKSPVNARIITVNFVSGISEISVDLAEKDLREIMDEEIVIHSTDYNRALTLNWQTVISTTYAINIIGEVFEGDTLTELIDAINEFPNFPYTASTPGTDQLTITPDSSNEFDEFWVDFVQGSFWKISGSPAYTDDYADEYSDFVNQFRGVSPDNRFRFPVSSNLHNFRTDSNIKQFSIINYYSGGGIAKNFVYQPSLPPPLSGTIGNPDIVNNTSLAPYVTVEYVLERIADFYDISIIAPFLGPDTNKLIIDHPNTLDRPTRYLGEKRIILFERSFNVADLVPDIKVNTFLKALQGLGYALVFNHKSRSLEYFLRDPILTQTTYTDLAGRFGEMEDIQNQPKRGITLRHADDSADKVSTVGVADADNGKKGFVIGEGERLITSGFAVPVIVDNSLTFPADISILDNVVTREMPPADNFTLRLAFALEGFFEPAMVIEGDDFSLSWFGTNGLAATNWKFWQDIENESPTVTVRLYLTEVEALTSPIWLKKVLIDRNKYLIRSYELSIKDQCEFHECEATLVRTPYSDRS
jgi:hypothetical protein